MYGSKEGLKGKTLWQDGSFSRKRMNADTGTLCGSANAIVGRSEPFRHIRYSKERLYRADATTKMSLPSMEWVERGFMEYGAR